MPLVFLDTPQLQRLERTLVGNPARFASFVEMWRSRGCSLVFPSPSIAELVRYRRDERRQGRFAVLEALIPIRTDAPIFREELPSPRTPLEREILRALFRKGIVTLGGERAEEFYGLWSDILPGHVDSTEQAAFFRLLEDPTFLELFTMEYDAARFAAAAASRETGANRRDSRLEELQDTPLTPEQIQIQRDQAEAAIQEMIEQSQRGELPPLSDEAIASVRAMFDRFISRSAEIGPRAAISDALPIATTTGGGSRRHRMRLGRLVQQSTFELQFRSLIADVLEVRDTERVESLLARVSLKDCPGTWLREGAQSFLQRAADRVTPNDSFDLDRLIYLPYVDLLFTDVRMVEYARQALRAAPNSEIFQRIREPVAIPDTMEALEAAIASVSTAAP